MRPIYAKTSLAALTLGGAALIASPLVLASDSGWSLVPYIGASSLRDQSPSFSGVEDITDGRANISIDQGFTAGLSVRYDYANSHWVSEFGWEYRSNDADTTAADNVQLASGDYASNTFYINGRYVLSRGSRVSTWLGGGATWIQEIDLDSEDAAGERSFSDSGSVGFQFMAGIDYDISNRLYLTSEIRYSSQSEIALREEGGSGRVTGLDYQPVTLGLGLGYRF